MQSSMLETVGVLGDGPVVRSGCEIWERLQSEKEQVTRDILSEGPLCHAEVSGILEAEASEEYEREIEWHHRGQLTTRLREINDAQDRLMDGIYGRCTDCRAEIDRRRLAADPAASLCITCQKTVESEVVFCTL